ncbi:MAG: hypothetical protein ABMA14_24560 [Hyphomonadaceae bacterium]
MSGWSINAAELRIPRRSRFAAHRMIVIADASGRAVRQINGLASWFNEEQHTWRHKPIGYLPSDRLRGYDSKTHPRTFMPINGAASPDWRLAPAIAAGAIRVLAEDLARDEIDIHLAPALEALRRINGLSKGPEGGAGLPDPFMGFGRNSNSFFTTMLHAMGFVEPTFAASAIIVPGARRLLLPAQLLDAIRTGSGENDDEIEHVGAPRPAGP